MTDTELFPQLSIPETLAAGPGPGNTDARVLASFANAGLADHMQADVLRGMVEAKHMLRRVWGTKNTYTFGVGGTGFSGLDALFSAILPAFRRCSSTPARTTNCSTTAATSPRRRDALASR